MVLYLRAVTFTAHLTLLILLILVANRHKQIRLISLLLAAWSFNATMLEAAVMLREMAMINPNLTFMHVWARIEDAQLLGTLLALIFGAWFFWEDDP